MNIVSKHSFPVGFDNHVRLHRVLLVHVLILAHVSVLQLILMNVGAVCILKMRHLRPHKWKRFLLLWRHGGRSAGNLFRQLINARSRPDSRRLSPKLSGIFFSTIHASAVGPEWLTVLPLLVFFFVLVRRCILRSPYWCTHHRPCYASHKSTTCEPWLMVHLRRSHRCCE